MKHIIRLITLAIFGTLLFASAPAQAAPTGLYLNPSTGTYQKDQTFAVQLRMNSGSNAGVQANLDFDVSKLQVLSVSDQGSALSNVTSAYNNSDGDISVYSVSSSDSGDRLVVTITFKAVGYGTTPVDFVRANSTLRYLLLVPLWSNIATTNASYTIPNPNTPPPVSGGGSTPPTSGSGSSSTAPRTSTTPKTATPTPATPQNGEAPLSTPDNPDEESATNVTPDKFTTPDFQTTKPDTEPWESSQETAKGSAIVPWLPLIVTVGLGLLTLGIFIAYRRTHISNSLRRLLAAVLSKGAIEEAAQPAPASPITSRIPLLASVMPTLLLGFTQPKLLASGIKQKLLGTGTTDKTKRQ